jgi:hypothetical protein
MTEMLVPSDNIESGAIPNCPYKGLHEYTEADGEYFFGRNSDRRLVIDNLMASRHTVLYGPSGVGKSSLLQAGVMRHLRTLTEEGANWIGRDMPQSFNYLAVPSAIVVYNSSWRNDSLKELGHALIQAIPEHDRIEDIIRTHRPLSVELIHELTERLNSYVYLLLDQFEEQTLYQPAPYGEAFLEELGNIITTPGLRASVLLGIREDALSKLDRLEAYVPGLYDNKLRLPHLNHAKAREAIEGPLNRYNELLPQPQHISIEPELIDELLPQLKTGTVSVGDATQASVDTSEEESIETPFLQLVMTRLWDEEGERGSTVLRRATLDDLGGANRIVRTHLDAVMSELTEQQQDIAANIFRHLVTPDGTKLSYTADDLEHIVSPTSTKSGLPVVLWTDPTDVKEVLEKLAAGRHRVLRPVPPTAGSNEAPRYEIFHDVMVPAVIDWRRRYVAERDRIAREHALLLERRQAEEELILERRQAEEQFHKTRKRYALLSLVLALLLVMATAIVVLALQ